MEIRTSAPDTLAGKVAVVTGASTGLGRGIAAAFARHGARVVVGDITEEPRPGNFDDDAGSTTVEHIRAAGGEAAFVPCDVTSGADVAALVAAARDRFGGLDMLVNNAGVWRGGRRMHEMTEDDLDACWRVLVKGSWFGAQEAVKAFLAQNAAEGLARGGSIINVVSTAGLRGHAGQAAYNMAKAAQANLTRCLALEYAADNIRSNGVCPTFVKTAMSRGGYDNPDFGETAIRRVVPVGRWGEISDVVTAALFLASDATAFLTGILIPVDGGETLGSARAV